MMLEYIVRSVNLVGSFFHMTAKNSSDLNRLRIPILAGIKLTIQQVFLMSATVTTA